MNRRDFLKAFGAILGAHVPGANLMISKPLAPTTLFAGELGRYEGIRILVSDPRAVKVYGAALFAEAMRGPWILGQTLGDE